MDFYPEKTIKELNQLAEKYNTTKELIRKELPPEFKSFLKDKVGKSFLNLTAVLETFFAMFNYAKENEKDLDILKEKVKEYEKELNQLRILKIEGELNELIEKIRATGGQATISVTLPNSPYK